MEDKLKQAKEAYNEHCATNGDFDENGDTYPQFEYLTDAQQAEWLEEPKVKLTESLVDKFKNRFGKV